MEGTDPRQASGDDGRVSGAGGPDGRSLSGAEAAPAKELTHLRSSRAALRSAFDPSDGKATPPSLALKNNEGWAEKKIVHQDDFDVYAVACAPGHDLPEHYHPMHDQYIWVMSGALTFSLKGGDTQTLRPGAAVTIPRGQSHSISPLSESSLMVMFRPPSSGEVPDAEILSSMIPTQR
ncbi:cupin domain-containing protein [Salinibacter ruber]|uniref:cupin domain-containing protein n=1 Tax=Salinibacter ruber TaxID=146919 RepID=UPI003C6E944F